MALLDISGTEEESFAIVEHSRGGGIVLDIFDVQVIELVLVPTQGGSSEHAFTFQS